jgi:Forkhead domain
MPHSNFPIGVQHYLDYLNANVNQLNLYNIPHSRDQTSGDSEPGSPASSHGGDRTAQTALIPVNSGADVQHDQLFSNSPFSDQCPRVPAQFEDHATGVDPTFFPTTSQLRPTSASERDEYGYTVRYSALVVSFSNSNLFLQASPTESVHSDQSASLSAYSGYSSGHSAQSGSSDGHYDPETTQRMSRHPQLYRREDNHGPSFEYRPAPPGTRPQHYYRMSEDGYQGVLAPEVLDADADIPGVSSQHSSPGSQPSPTLYTIASSSTSSSPAVGLKHLPWPSIQAPPSNEAEHYLRHQMSLPRDKPVNLWALKDPPNRGKPSQPYPELIKLAIFGSANKKLTLQEIYKALIDRFEWFKDNSNEMAWKVCFKFNMYNVFYSYLLSFALEFHPS